MKLEGKLPVIRMTATILPGRITGRVRILGPRGGFRKVHSTPRDPSVARRAATGKRAT